MCSFIFRLAAIHLMLRKSELILLKASNDVVEFMITAISNEQNNGPEEIELGLKTTNLDAVGRVARC